MERYAEHYTHANVWLERIDTLREGEVANSSTWYPESELRKTEYYADWLRPQGLAYALGGPVLKRESVIAMFSLLRPERRGLYEESDLRLMRLLMPHLRRGCLLHQRVAAARARQATIIAALEAVPSAMWILGTDGQLLHANCAGQELDRRRDGLWIGRDGRPAAADPDEHQALRGAIDAAIDVALGRGFAGSGAVYVRRWRSDVPCKAAALPLDAAKSLFGLTPTEADLATALARGDSLKDYCEARCVTLNTAHAPEAPMRQDRHAPPGGAGQRAHRRQPATQALTAAGRGLSKGGNGLAAGDAAAGGIGSPGSPHSELGM